MRRRVPCPHPNCSDLFGAENIEAFSAKDSDLHLERSHNPTPQCVGVGVPTKTWR